MIYSTSGISIVSTDTAIAIVNSVPPSALMYICNASDSYNFPWILRSAPATHIHSTN